jgi:hypothetical protein
MHIVTRDEWGAVATTGMTEARYPMAELWLHHSDTVPTSDPAADMRQLQQIGFSRGFADISYTFGIHPDGSILEGRDLRYVGAHTFANNPTSLAFVLIGDYTSTPPTDAQIASARWLRDHLVSAGYLAPGTYPTGGHRDAPQNETACPGDAAQTRLDQFRQASAAPPAPETLERPKEGQLAISNISVGPGKEDAITLPATGTRFGITMVSVTLTAGPEGADCRAVLGPNWAGLDPDHPEDLHLNPGERRVVDVDGNQTVLQITNKSATQTISVLVEVM